MLLNSIPNWRSNQAYVQGLDYESINFKAAVNTFKLMETAEYIYEVVV